MYDAYTKQLVGYMYYIHKAECKVNIIHISGKL